MRVAKLVGPNKIDVVNEDFNEKPNKGQVTVKVRAVGICGTDYHIFKGERADVEFPRIMGHELSGDVVEVGEGVSNVKKGDRVVLDPVLSCGECALCKGGHPNICAQVKCYGVQADGGNKDYIIVDADKLYQFPDELNYVEAALSEPFSIAANILDRSALKAGEKMVIIGAGTIGLCLAQAAKGLGADILVSDVVPGKLELAKQIGADAIVNSKEESLEEAVKAFAPTGLDVVIDCVGIVPLFEQTIAMATPMTRIVCIGFDGHMAQVPPIDITKKELTIVGSRMNALKFPTVMEWMKNKTIDPKVMVSKVFAVEDIQKAFEYATSTPTAIKTVVTFDEKN